MGLLTQAVSQNVSTQPVEYPQLISNLSHRKDIQDQYPKHSHMGLLTQADGRDVATRCCSHKLTTQHMPKNSATGRKYKTSTQNTVTPNDMSFVSYLFLSFNWDPYNF